ncbi:hypothetical protein [Microbacterium sp. E-13]|uniref:hypothetical protein n=1 Tax=Microbacterium sp. E-13 TaxID=3404048 RepID=UPI003CE79FEB
MSTTGNEYEQPGVNYPDREDAAGAANTPTSGEPARDQHNPAAPALGEPAPDAEPVGAWTEAPEQGEGAAAAAGGGAARSAATDESVTAQPQEGSAATGPSDGARSGEPSHEAVGIGVIDTSDHHGQDENRDTMTVGQAQREPGALGTEQEQRLPAMSQNNASDVEKVTGIVAQTRQDVGTESEERIIEVLRQRLDQSGIDLPDSDIQELARQIWTGDAASPTDPGHGAPA